MRQPQRKPFLNDERTSLLGDALGATALFILLLAALHLPLFA